MRDVKRTLARLTGSPEAIARTALAAFGVIAFTGTVVAIAESYSNLLAFAEVHRMSGWKAWIAPSAADSFIVMGELLLFAYILRRWDSALAFSVGAGMAVWGFLLSVGGNVWHVPSADPVDKALGAIWPVTATVGMAGSLIVLELVMNGRGTGQAVNPGATARKPPPAPPGEPLQEASGRAARAAEPAAAPERVLAAASAGDHALVAASETERAAVFRLVNAGEPLPSVRALAASDFGGSIRTAARVLRVARARMDGGGHDVAAGS